MSHACEQLGRSEVVRRCAAMVAGERGDPEFVLLLGGEPAKRLLAAGVPAGQAYWLRVWAARGLLWAGPEAGTHSLRRALGDESWRVREMACKVVARHAVEGLLDQVAALESDPIARVRNAAHRAVIGIVGRPT